MRERWVLSLVMLPVIGAAALVPVSAPNAAPGGITWRKQVLDRKFRAEGAAAADVNRDGKMDVFAGNFWYEAPDWKPHAIRPAKEFEPATGYSNCFLTFAEDVDRDGWTDQLVIGFPGDKSLWYRNPGRSGSEWTEHLVAESACNESPIYADLNGDRRPELITPYKESRMAYYQPGKKPLERFEQFLIGSENGPGTKKFSHGLGVGDIDGDGAPDILCSEGFYRNPGYEARPRRNLFSRLFGADPKPGRKIKPGAWEFVPAALGPACAQMYTHDFDRDGDMDVISSSAHAVGVWWYEQRPGKKSGHPEFVQHTIDDTFSQTHSLMPADINGDGQVDFVTGKRWWAHGPKGDVNPNDPAVLYWFEFRTTRRRGKDVPARVEWKRHLIDSDSGVGTQFSVAHMNRDRRPDLVISNKKGVFVFTQESR